MHRFVCGCVISYKIMSYAVNEVSAFKHEMFGDTRIINEGGELFFVAKDVVEKVGNVWNGTANIKHVPERWRGVISVMTPRRTQDTLCLSEQGLYFYLGRCDKPAALQFQMSARW